MATGGAQWADNLEGDIYSTIDHIDVTMSEYTRLLSPLSSAQKGSECDA